MSRHASRPGVTKGQWGSGLASLLLLGATVLATAWSAPEVQTAAAASHGEGGRRPTHDRTGPNDRSEGDDRAATGEDSAPGEHGESLGSASLSYLIGLGLAGLLTAASFYASETGLIYGPGVPFALTVLAIAQMGVHLVFFLHMTTSPDNINNAMALAFGVLIVTLLVGGTVWILMHMNSNMMPAGMPMRMP